jgi:hypothetical protein
MARAPTPSPAKNTDRVTRPDTSATQQWRPAENRIRPNVSTQERNVLEGADAQRAEYRRETEKGREAMAAEALRQAREQESTGQTGRDAACGHGGIGDYLSRD